MSVGEDLLAQVWENLAGRLSGPLAIACSAWLKRGIAVLITAFMLGAMLQAREARAAEDEATELAKKTQNPVADLISVPFQSNFNFGTGTKDATVYVLNVQPVIPFPCG
jgi:hypothetical protein